jgi:hypothetical protein
VGKPRTAGIRTVENISDDLVALSPDELRKVERHVKAALRAHARVPVSVPVEIFALGLSPAEAVVRHLKEQHRLTFSEIAKLLNRDQRGIWGSYQRSQRKAPQATAAVTPTYLIPLSVFRDRSRSILEHVVTHLREKHELPVTHICALLKKKPSTVWTTLRRARAK